MPPIFKIKLKHKFKEIQYFGLSVRFSDPKHFLLYLAALNYISFLKNM